MAGFSGGSRQGRSHGAPAASDSAGPRRGGEGFAPPAEVRRFGCWPPLPGRSATTCPHFPRREYEPPRPPPTPRDTAALRCRPRRSPPRGPEAAALAAEGAVVRAALPDAVVDEAAPGVAGSGRPRSPPTGIHGARSDSPPAQRLFLTSGIAPSRCQRSIKELGRSGICQVSPGPTAQTSGIGSALAPPPEDAPQGHQKGNPSPEASPRRRVRGFFRLPSACAERWPRAAPGGRPP